MFDHRKAGHEFTRTDPVPQQFKDSYRPGAMDRTEKPAVPPRSEQTAREDLIQAIDAIESNPGFGKVDVIIKFGKIKVILQQESKEYN